MAYCRSSSIWLFFFVMLLPLSAYSELGNGVSCSYYRWVRGSSCITCALNCRIICSHKWMDYIMLSCNKAYIKDCECCCIPFSPPPSPPSRSPPPQSPPPLPPPPPPPSAPPSPTGDKCDKPGDTYSEITYPTSDCSYCTNWCRDECSELKEKVVSNQCSIGESKFVIRCKCCCRKNPSLKLYGNKDDGGIGARFS